MVYRRCRNPNHPEGVDRFHDKKLPCPHCGDEAVFNKALRMGQLNNHLYGMADRQQKEERFAKKVLGG